MTQLTLTFRPDLSLADLPQPKFSYAEANLHFTQRVSEMRGGFMMFDDEADDRTRGSRLRYISSCKFPDGKVVEVSEVGGHLVNDVGSFLRRYDALVSAENRAWVKANADELDNSRRYYLAVIANERVAKLEDELRVARIKLNVSLYQATEGRMLPDDERRRVALEFGARSDEV